MRHTLPSATKEKKPKGRVEVVKAREKDDGEREKREERREKREERRERKREREREI